MGKEIDFSSSNAIESSSQVCRSYSLALYQVQRANSKPEKHTAREFRVIEARKKREFEENRS